MTSQITMMLMVGFTTVFLMMFVLWLIHLKIKNAGIVDVGWGLGFCFLVLVYAFLGEGFNLKTCLMIAMVLFWGFRISGFLIKRIAHEVTEDKRYQKLRSEWKSNLNLKFFFFFEFQAVLQIILSLPFLFISLDTRHGLGVWEIAGVIIWAVSLIGESIADEQLSSFKRNPKNKGKVCDIGLWNYSRHPNYFFECMIWFGFFIFSLASPNALIGIISPIGITFLIMFVSGVPMAEEQSLKSRGDLYREYQRTTSVLIPLPKRK